MNGYVGCYNKIMDIGDKLAKSDDLEQISIGKEIINAMRDLDNIIEDRLEQKRTEALDQISNILCDNFSTEVI